MTECAYAECDRDADGSILWITGTMRNYCRSDLRQSRSDYPELIEEVDLL